MKIPDGHVLAEDPDYVIQGHEYYYCDVWERYNIDTFDKLDNISLVGKKIIDLDYINNYGKKIRFYIAIPGKPKPKFKCDKEYPFGY